MNARNPVLALVLALTGPVAAAAPAKPSHGLLPLHLQSLLKSSRKTPAKAHPRLKAGDCIDLSGRWHGTCRDSTDSDPYDNDVEIDQDSYCEYITIGGLDLDIDGSTTMQSSSVAYGSDSFNFFPRWNTSRNLLRVYVRYAGNYQGQGLAFTDETVEYSLLEQRLVVTSKAEIEEITDAGPVRTNYAEECTYDKVP